MSTNTSKFSFIKPELTDPADITAMNGNWDKVEEELIGRIKSYKTLEELGLTESTATTNSIMQAMTSNTMAVLEVNVNWTAATEIPDKYTTMILFKKFNGRTVGILISVASQHMWFGSQHSGGSFGGWVEPSTTESYSATLKASDWSSGTKSTQYISVDGILNSDEPFVDVNILNVSNASAALEAWGHVGSLTVSGDGVLLATCYNGAPTIDIPIRIKVVR